VKDDATALTKRDLAEHDVTSEVGDEGGTPGDVERRATDEVGTGSEASETWRPAEEKEDDVRRDETGIGRRNP
jgi:hypothetical protein